MKEEEAGTTRGEEGGDVGCGWWVGVDVFEVPSRFISMCFFIGSFEVNSVLGR